MAVLLTGGAGYIGSHTAVELLNEGYEVVIADDLSNSSEEAIRRVEKITGKTVSFYRCDVREWEALNRIFADNSIEAVIHFAGLKAVGESVREPLRYYRVNLDAAMTVLEGMQTHGVKRFVFSSSATVYGAECPFPYTEDMETGGCTNPYGWTKFMIEQIVTDTAKATGMSAVLLRYFNPVGAHPSGLIGEDPAGIPNNLMPFVSQVAVGKLKRLNIFGNDYPTPDGTGVRDYIHIVDLAKGHVAALVYAEQHTGTEVFNLGRGSGVSVLELVENFERANDIKIPYVFTERREGDIAECWADTTKAKELLGWTAKLGLEDMCRDSWNWQRQNPNGYDE
ncbi:MAG: UDP-glucose 4-epimerase GalE [Clostridiales bacterium]|nr:UDP-glucose 4-epimerase GalE [Clostridiales bacterium]